MKAAVTDTGGAPESLRIITLPDPQPGEGEVLIRVEAISIEGGDLIDRREGKTRNPAVPGYAAAGTIVALGDGVDGFVVGQRVTSFAFTGSHAELRAAPAATTFAVPDALDLATAVAIPCGPGTAALALHLGRLTSDDVVLVTGATGGVGNAAVQIAARRGARVIGTSRSHDGLERLRTRGLSDGIVTGDGMFADRVRALTGGRGADLLIDAIGGGTLTEGLAALVDGGRAVMVGAIGGFDTPIDVKTLFFHRLTVTGCLMGIVMGAPATRAMIVELLAAAARGELTVPIDATYPLDDIASAHRRAEERGALGRVIVTSGAPPSRGEPRRYPDRRS